MAKTIIQTIGPLYGEVVNGTVFGRPNGSIYVPNQNTITISIADQFKYIRYVAGGYYSICTSTGALIGGKASIVAESQDLQNYIEIQISKSSDFATLESINDTSAGLFNISVGYIGKGVSLTPIVDGDTYYVRAVLMSVNGDPVATSEAIEVIGVEV
jgi:hypothetical protein